MPIKQLSAVVTLQIPENLICVDRVEYERLQASDDYGRWWSIEEVLDRIPRGRTWFKENVLANPKYRKRIDIKNGGFVKYPNGGRDSYAFHATRTKKFIDENLGEILKNS